MIICGTTSIAHHAALGAADDWPKEVIEVTNAGRPAWLVKPVELERDSITFDFAQAGVFSTDPRMWMHSATTTWNRLRCGYPQWQCRIVLLTDEYRAAQAEHILPRLPGPA